MKQYAAMANYSDIPVSLEREDLQWMSQWSAEEELLADYEDLRAPWAIGSAIGLCGTSAGATVLLTALAAFGIFTLRTGHNVASALPLQSSHFI